ncbi:hypothetical protein G6F70_008695 [Rhizopus microsporus]|uniref:non-specific serine/threonine protein kinase n=2 Tax=Rhizopus TaxID=4842 RepID=A0A367JQX8_RHIAZ|nr:hypothetical protein G6F71_008648 [Rhizopus microsporus]RCH92285.1 serine/threonine-protein kinase KIN2 [Rhizopus azygosporus]KAG1194836.1 hypothetical protein G6F70_008695 [Rhizopus microsporus]KAG1206655.1 hypothetical protein G6F69_008668 [Rhizopus microsporus]KAG1226402.1 hypothetical protein G6F67_008994 [Rhizopus microsporus]
MSFSDSVNDCDSESSNDLVDRSWEENIYHIKDKLVNGPDGNKILIDSPTPSELPPPYPDSDRPLTTTNIRDQSRELREPSSSSSNGGINRQPKPRRVIGNYTLSSTIGAGSMGKVRLAIHNTTKEKLAVKIIPKVILQRDKMKDENREARAIREANILLLLHHPYIVSLKEMVDMDDFYYLFMEYVAGGQLLDYIISHGRLKEKQARRFARQILSALDYCHRNSIVHRDLKIENILVSQEGNIKIIDFGLSNLFSTKSNLSTFCGSLYFAAPELLNAKAYTGPEVDVWSFGVVLYVLLCGKVPFDDGNTAALHKKIKRGVFEFPYHLSTECRAILSRMLVVNPAHRATVSELMVHPWMNKGYDCPVKNHLPDRLPLSLPINMDVIRQMTGFEFGTEEQIKEKLEAIVTSEEYQIASQTAFERSMEVQRNHRQSQLYSYWHPVKSFSLPNEDPQSIPAAYDPLISIYYLVKERMERERLEAERQAEEQCPTSPERIHKPLAEYIQHHNHYSSEKKSPHLDFVLDTDEDNKQHNIINAGLTRLFSKSSRNNNNNNRQHSDEGSSTVHPTTSISANNRPHTHHNHNDNNNEQSTNENVFRRLSVALSRNESRPRKASATTAVAAAPVPITSSSTSASPAQVPNLTVTTPLTPIHIPSNCNNNHPTPYLSQSYAPYPNMLSPKPAKPRVAGAKTPIPRRMTIGQSPINELPKLTQQQVQEKSPVPSSSQGTADENIKPVFLKGLFSVSTTSTKHPSVIRADLIRVLERISVRWRESKGRFECVHMPSIDLKKVAEEDQAVPVPDLVVRFEIYIVKVPWLLGMHGLQFRRVGGDLWQYKTMCSRILAELKL